MSRIRISALGLDTLQLAGLKALLRELPDDFLLTTEEGTADSDLLIAAREYFIRHIDTLSAQKEKLLVLSDELIPGYNILSPTAAAEKIVEQIKELASSIGQADTLSDRRLSARETEVLRCLAGGLTAKEIADKLCISTNTVVTHRKNISAKLGIRSLSGLTLYAVMNGLLNMK